MEFDHTGNYLATGDKGGRVVLFERNETVSDILHAQTIDTQNYKPIRYELILILYRRKLANTNFILNSNLTSLNLIT